MQPTFSTLFLMHDLCPENMEGNMSLKNPPKSEKGNGLLMT